MDYDEAVFADSLHSSGDETWDTYIPGEYLRKALRQSPAQFCRLVNESGLPFYRRDERGYAAFHSGMTPTALEPNIVHLVHFHIAEFPNNYRVYPALHRHVEEYIRRFCKVALLDFNQFPTQDEPDDQVANYALAEAQERIQSLEAQLAAARSTETRVAELEAEVAGLRQDAEGATQTRTAKATEARQAKTVEQWKAYFGEGVKLAFACAAKESAFTKKELTDLLRQQGLRLNATALDLFRGAANEASPGVIHQVGAKPQGE